MALVMIIWVITTMLLRLYVIRKIEKRLGQKLIFISPVSRVNPLFGSVVEVTLYITVKYFQARFYRKPLPHFKYYNFNNFALKHSSYNINDASSSEIFFSFCWILCDLWFMVGGLLLYILHK